MTTTGTNFTYNQFTAGTAIVASETNANNSAIDVAFTQVLNGTKSHTAFQATGAATLSGATTLSGVTTLSGATTISGVLQGASPLTFEGTTANAHETTLAVTDPTADRTITLPDATGTVAFLDSDITGNAATATELATARAINGVDFDGTAPITVTADANTLSNTTLKSTVVASSLTSVGTLSALALSGAITGATEITASTFVRGGAGSESDPSIRMGDSNSGFYGGNSEIKAAVDGAIELELTSTSLLVPNVYNNTTASAANVQVHTNGSIRRSTSTRAIKTNIQPLADDGLLEGLTPVSFNSIVDDDQSFWGFVAEDSFDIDPHFTDHQSDKISDRAILAKLVARVTTLTARLEALEAV